MDSGELSDLEEGEILEYDSYSPVESCDDFEMKNRHFNQFKRQNVSSNFGTKKNERNWCFPEQDRYEDVSKDFKGSHNINGKLSKFRPMNLESISSEGEYKSDDVDKYPFEPRDYIFNEDKRTKSKHPMHLYGTVEYIMSAIGETILRKSRCNYKKKKSKDFFKYSDKSYDLWRDKIFSSHLKGKKRKRKIDDSDSESEFLKIRVEERKKRARKRKVYYEDEETATKKPKIRDFDEMRRCLLEKRKKEEAEVKLKALTCSNPPPEVDSTEIQEVDMLIECTNYVDDPTAGVQNDSTASEILPAQEKEGEDEMDLMKLRLIALASNKKRKSVASTETIESVVDDPKTEDSDKKPEIELDRNELLLRAEALKTALLNKHQKRLKKLKMNTSKAAASSSDNDMNASLFSPIRENVIRKDEERVNVQNNCKEDEQRKNSEEECKISDVQPENVSHAQESLTKEKEATSVTDANPKKSNQKVRGKRKKRKSLSLANSLKENSDKTETIEEDDNTLRSQLLSDLMRKKSLKDLDKKPVLTDSMQTSANQILSPAAVGEESPKENRKPPPTAKKTALKKVNVAKGPKAGLVPKVPVPEIQRIIIHLGSEDSSDENGGNEEDKIPNPPTKESEAKVVESATVELSTEREKNNEMIKADYEKSVELLLSEARKKIEGKIQSAKNNNSTATPEAVYKHLPPSQRLEYIRLKQKIAERERQRIQSSVPGSPNVQDNRSNSDNLPLTTSVVSKNSLNLSKVFSKSNSANGTTNKAKTNVASVSVKATKKHLTSNSSNSIGSNSLLLPSSQALISKLKLLLKKIKIEKTIEENYEKEISKLKNQLNLFERKKTEQRFKIKKLGEESMKTYRAIQRITAKSNGKASTAAEEKKEVKKLEGKENATEVKKKEEKIEEEKEEDEKMKEEKIEEKEKEKIEERKEATIEKTVEKTIEEKIDEKIADKMEEEKQIEERREEEEEEGKNVPNEPETDISKAESTIDKEPNSECDNGGRASERVSDGTTTTATFSVGFLEYSSPLEVFKKASDGANRLDPNVMMCQFDLMGVCKDEECAYQHLRTS